ncbi:ribonuclease M [Thozetella sp. PMI_491]|nr:ribonuclease M [Thozetella sp. PMI_491]
MSWKQSTIAAGTFVLGTISRVLAGSPITCNSTFQLSCHNTTSQTDLCCFNAPGGSLLQTQFWDYDPSIGPSDSWGIHGLWPDNCDGSFEENCDKSRAYKNITQILKKAGEADLLDYMETYWQANDKSAEQFWEHEWATHGTCISTLSPACFDDYEQTEEVPYFFNTTVSLFKSLPTFDWLSAAGITPSESKTYTLSGIQNALSSKHGKPVYLSCSDGALSSVYYYFNIKGPLLGGQWTAADPVGQKGSCPTKGIKYPPKSSSSRRAVSGKSR